MSRKNVLIIVVLAVLCAALTACGSDGCEPGMAVSPVTGKACPATNSTTGQVVEPTPAAPSTDQQLIDAAKRVVPAMKDAVKIGSNSSPAGIVKGDPGTIIYGAGGPNDPCRTYQCDSDGDVRRNPVTGEKVLK